MKKESSDLTRNKETIWFNRTFKNSNTLFGKQLAAHCDFIKVPQLREIQQCYCTLQTLDASPLLSCCIPHLQCHLAVVHSYCLYTVIYTCAYRQENVCQHILLHYCILYCSNNTEEITVCICTNMQYTHLYIDVKTDLYRSWIWPELRLCKYDQINWKKLEN